MQQRNRFGAQLDGFAPNHAEFDPVKIELKAGEPEHRAPDLYPISSNGPRISEIFQNVIAPDQDFEPSLWQNKRLQDNDSADQRLGRNGRFEMQCPMRPNHHAIW
jgi:hypothetical protein